MGILEPQFGHFGPPLGSLRAIFGHGGAKLAPLGLAFFFAKTILILVENGHEADQYSFLGFRWWSFGCFFGDWVGLLVHSVEFIYHILLFCIFLNL
jgi:hypothetical protein